MDDVNNILSAGSEEQDEQLMNYLKGNLSGDELQMMEKQWQDDAFVKDALEGLQQFSSDKKLDQYVRTLNQNLQQQLTVTKQKRGKRNLTNPSWLLLATVLILLLCIMAYAVVMFVKYH